MYQQAYCLLLFCFLYVLPSFGSTDTLVIHLEKKASLLQAKKDYESANKVLDTLAIYFLKQNEFVAYIESQLKINNNLSRLTENQAAIKHLNKTIQQIEKVDDSSLDSLIALTYHKQGINFHHENNFHKAILYFKKALLLRQGFLPKDHLDLLKGNFNIGSAYFQMWDYDHSIVFYNEALAVNLSRTKPIKVRLAKTYNMLGQAHFRKGDVEIGEEYLLAALDLFKIVYENAPWNLAKLYMDFSSLYDAPDIESATTKAKYALKAIKTYEKIEGKEEEDWWGIANAYNNLGIAYEIRDSLYQALKAYEQSLMINQRFEDNRQDFIAQTFNNISFLYKKQKKYELALVNVDKAITINKKQENGLVLARNYHNKGAIFFGQNKYEKALSFQQKALQQVIYPFDIKNDYQNPKLQNAIILDKIRVLEYFAAKAKALEGLATQSNPEKNYVAAIRTYETLLELVDIIRLNFQTDASKSFLSGNTKIWLEQAIQTTLNLAEITNDKSYLEKAFAFAERSKAAVLLEAVQRHQAKMELTLDHPLIQKEQQLLRMIAAQEQQIFSLQNEDTNEVVTALRTDLLVKRQQLQAVRDSLEQTGIYNKQYDQTTFSIAAIRQQFLKNKETSIVQFFVGEKNIFRFVLQKEDLIVDKIALDFPLQQEIEKLRNGIYQTYISNKNFSDQEKEALNQQYAKQAHQLYQQLFFKNNQAIDLPPKIIIIPDGMLGYIPFDALVKQAVESGFSDFTQYDFLARHHQISYAYSSALLLDAYQKNKRSHNQELLAFLPDYNSSATISYASDRHGFAPLKYSQEEVDNILKILPNGQLISAATKQDFQDLATNFAMLHFSAHAMVNPENPDYSFIAFSQKNKEIDETQLLFINDIYASTLLADMVVLSACETGLGKIEKGEGVMSLARAFTYAGAKSIITSLWRVNDRKTAELMTRFYEYLEAGHPKDEALFLSKQDFIKKGIDIHPYFWAGFVPIGNMSPLEKPSSWWMYVVLGIGVSGLGFFSLKKFF